MAQLMPLPLIVSCFSKVLICFTFLVLAHPGCLGQRAIKRVCECLATMPKALCFPVAHLSVHANGEAFSGQLTVDLY